jgi:hypothetical protein
VAQRSRSGPRRRSSSATWGSLKPFPAHPLVQPLATTPQGRLGTDVAPRDEPIERDAYLQQDSADRLAPSVGLPDDPKAKIRYLPGVPESGPLKLDLAVTGGLVETNPFAYEGGYEVDEDLVE